MRRTLLATVTILVTITLLPSPTVQTQQPEKDQFPKPHNPEKDQFPRPETYPQAGASCKDKRKLEPWLGMPDVGPGKSRCVLSVSNCQTDKTDVYRSAPRDSGTVSLDCSDYERATEALGRIEICCDNGSPDPAPPVPAPLPPPPTPTPEPNCTDSTVTPTLTIDLADPLNIDETPQMPEIKATARVTPSSTDVSWTAQITYRTPPGCSGGPQFDGRKVTGEGETFTPNFGEIYGGKLEITATTRCGTGASTTIKRDVGGVNADAVDVQNEIGTMDSPFEADDLKKIACQESHQRQFKGDNTPLLGQQGTRGDVGIMQICYMRVVGDVWNWKTNVAKGRANLLNQVTFSRGVPLFTRRGYTIKYVNGRPERVPYLPRGQGPFPNATDFTPEQLRLEAIKRYNAGNTPDVGYWEWDDGAGAWVANPQGGGDPAYVANVLAKSATCP